MGWWFSELTGIFFAASIIIAVIDRFPVDDFIDIFVNGAKDLLSVALIIGVARGVSVIMTDASITDTILHYGEMILTNVSSGIFSGAAYIIYGLLSFLIPSSSGLATLTMSIMAPLADFAGVGREIVVIAFQSGNAIMSLIAPTCGLLMGVLAMTKTSYGTWIKFIWKLLLYCVLVTIAVLVGASIILY